VRRAVDDVRGRPPTAVRSVGLGVALGAGFVVLTVLSLGPLQPIDVELNRPYQQWWPEWRGTVRLVVRLGQRAVCLPVLLVVAAYAARRARSWAPLLTTLVCVIWLNLVVGLTKLATDRDKPRTGDPDFFEEGIIYPSGHSANAVLVYGLAAYLARRYVGRTAVLTRVLLVAAVLVSVVMVACSLYLQTHWITDLVAGLLVGGAVLASAADPRGVIHRLTEVAHRSMGGRR